MKPACVCSSYPGTPSTEITEAAAKFEEIYCEWAPNEKSQPKSLPAHPLQALVLCAMKHVGFERSSRPFVHYILHRRKRRRWSLLFADDPGMHSSSKRAGIPVTMPLHLRFPCWNLPILGMLFFYKVLRILFQRI